MSGLNIFIYYIEKKIQPESLTFQYLKESKVNCILFPNHGGLEAKKKHKNYFPRVT